MEIDQRPPSRSHADEPHLSIEPPAVPRRRLRGPLRQALRWAWREILLALLAAFIVGLGAGAAEALISWATS